MTNQEIRMRCVEITNKAAVRTGIAFVGSDNEPYLKRAQDVFEYATAKGADPELRLKCAEAALNTVSKRGFMSDLLLTKMRQIEEFVLVGKADDKDDGNTVTEPPPIKKATRRTKSNIGQSQ